MWGFQKQHTMSGVNFRAKAHQKPMFQSFEFAVFMVPNIFLSDFRGNAVVLIVSNQMKKCFQNLLGGLETSSGRNLKALA